MAARNPPIAEAPVEAAPKKKKSKLLLIVVIALVVALAGAGGGYFWWKATHADEDTEEGADAKPAKKAGKKGEKAEKEKKDKKAKDRKPPVYVPLEVFTVNLQPSPNVRERDRMLQVAITVEVVDGAAADALKAAMPVVRGQVLLLLSSRTAEELSHPDGKDKLAREIVERIQKPVDRLPTVAGVERVHYSAFIIQ